MEVEAPESGVLRKILAHPDEVVPVKEPIAIIGTADEPIDHLLAPQEGEVSRKVEAHAAPTEPLEAKFPAKPADREVPPAEEEVRLPEAEIRPLQPEGRIFASPAAKRVAREHGIDIAVLAGRGTGPNGRIVEKDVLEYIASMPKLTPLASKIAADLGVSAEAVTGTGVGRRVTSEDVRRAAAVPTPQPSIGQRIPFAGLRKGVAQAVESSARAAVHVTLVTEVDMTECVKMRESILQDIEARYGVRVSYTDIIVKAAARAIEDKQIVNSSIEGDSIVIHDQINIGIATAVEGGLVVPVVRDVRGKTIPQISVEAKELIARAREGKSGADDFKGGTFTITNLGTYGVDSFTPIITPGQSAILGVGRIIQKPAVVEGRIEVRSMMTLSLTFDHRVMDGAPAAEFLARVRQILESPYLMFV
ncbi:MAG: 2-oxo acid dehydrogenase subunit E2, partial [Armatimonadetes bacterium]|nr:2-oxo acid dehydrogenase subunit E2 [Armatimonadota bacterium]